MVGLRDGFRIQTVIGVCFNNRFLFIHSGYLKKSIRVMRIGRLPFCDLERPILRCAAALAVQRNNQRTPPFSRQKPDLRESSIRYNTFSQGGSTLVKAKPIHLEKAVALALKFQPHRMHPFDRMNGTG